MGSLIEMSIGTAIGAVTFTGSIIAFGKLQGFVSGNPLVFKGQHFLNLLLGLGIIALIVKFCIDQNQELFWLIVAARYVHCARLLQYIQEMFVSNEIFALLL